MLKLAHEKTNANLKYSEILCLTQMIDGRPEAPHILHGHGCKQISSLRFLGSEKWHDPMEEDLRESQHLHMQFALWPVIPCWEISLWCTAKYMKRYTSLHMCWYLIIYKHKTYHKTVCMRNWHTESGELEDRICLHQVFLIHVAFLFVLLTSVIWEYTSILCCPVWRPLATCGSWNCNYIRWQVQTQPHWPHFKCSVAHCGKWLPYWMVHHEWERELYCTAVLRKEPGRRGCISI